jgi:hypothetical protein
VRSGEVVCSFLAVAVCCVFGCLWPWPWCGVRFPMFWSYFLYTFLGSGSQRSPSARLFVCIGLCLPCRAYDGPLGGILRLDISDQVTCWTHNGPQFLFLVASGS